MTRVGQRNFLFLKKKIFVSHSDGTRREDGMNMVCKWYADGILREDGIGKTQKFLF